MNDKEIKSLTDEQIEKIGEDFKSNMRIMRDILKGDFKPVGLSAIIKEGDGTTYEEL